VSLNEQFGITTILVTIAEKGCVFEIEASRKVGNFFMPKSDAPLNFYFSTTVLEPKPLKTGNLGHIDLKKLTINTETLLSEKMKGGNNECSRTN
jgi:hypothetical protein